MKKEAFLKQTSSVDRLSGEEGKVDEFKRYLEATFNDQKMESWELEKTEGDKTMISIVLEEMPQFLAKYGGTMPPLTLNHFHAVNIDAENAPRLKGDAGFQSRYQRIIYSPKILGLEPRLSRSQTMAHEVLHFSAYQYFKEGISPSGSSGIGFKRAGLQIRREYDDNGLLEEISGKVDEAVTDELAIRFTKESLSKNPWLLEDLPQQGSATDENSLHELKEDEQGRLYFQPNSYAREIRALNNLIKHVIAKKPEIYKTEEEVFDLFAKATLTNELMPLIRALRNSMGKELWLPLVKVSFLK